MQLSIRQATPQDIDAVADILREAADWLEERGMPMWRQDELQPNRIVADVDLGQFFLAECDGVPTGTIRFQLEDRLFWLDVPQDDSAFIHRLAVKRRFTGGEVSSALLLWAIARTHRANARDLKKISLCGRNDISSGLGVFAPLREAYPNPRAFDHQKICAGYTL